MKPILAIACLLVQPAAAQLPNTLLRSVPAPSVGVQQGSHLGYSVAADGNYIVIGAADFDDAGGSDSGLAKVFDLTTGALVCDLPNPNPANNDQFGKSVAVSGTRVVVGSAGRVYVYDLASGTPATPVLMLAGPISAAGGEFGAVAISGARLVVGAAGDRKAYLYELSSGTPAVPVTILASPGSTAGDFFGARVAVSGSKVVVGAYGDDTGAFQAGSAYVYDLSSSTPTVPAATLHNPSPALGDHVGISVAILGSRVVVGADSDDTGAPNIGSAYVYELGSATPTLPVTTLNNPGAEQDSYFGHSVSISGSRIVVGAYGADLTVTDAGSAYVFDLASATPAVPAATLNNPAPATSDQFGSAVAISGNWVVAGAWLDNTLALDAGSAYLYDLHSGTPESPVGVAAYPGPAAYAGFGDVVALSGARMVVGGYQDDLAAADAGIAFVYDFASTTPEEPVTVLTKPGAASGDYFGFAAGISGTRVVVGAYGDDTAGAESGSAYVFDLASATPAVPVATLNNPTPAISDLYGTAVAISGATVAVGAPFDDTEGSDRGSVYVYDMGSATPAVPVLVIPNPSASSFEFFGRHLAIDGPRLIVGAHWNDTGGSNSGRAYVYDLSSPTPAVPLFTLHNPSPADNDEFGSSVAISGARVVIGAGGDNTGATNAGSGYVYDLDSATPAVPIFTLNNPAPADGDLFASSVAISGNRIVVAASGDDAGAADAGSAYVYDLGSATPTVPAATLNNPNPTTNHNFGRVAIDGATSAIAIAIAEDTFPVSYHDKGYTYIFAPADSDGDGLPDSWELAHYGATTGHSALDDSDHDGYSDMLELAFGLNPIISNPGGLPPVTQEGGYLTMTITKQPGVTYEVQTAGTLITGQPDSFSAASTTVLIDDATTLKVRDNFLISANPRRFIRTQVTAAP